MKLLSLVIYTQQLEKMRDFYEALGVQLTPEQHGNGPEHFSCQLGEVLVEIYPSESSTTSKFRFELGTEEIEAVVRRLVTRSFIRQPQQADLINRGLHLFDPDGNTVIVSSL